MPRPTRRNDAQFRWIHYKKCNISTRNGWIIKWFGRKTEFLQPPLNHLKRNNQCTTPITFQKYWKLLQQNFEIESVKSVSGSLWWNRELFDNIYNQFGGHMLLYTLMVQFSSPPPQRFDEIILKVSNEHSTSWPEL